MSAEVLNNLPQMLFCHKWLINGQVCNFEMLDLNFINNKPTKKYLS